MENGEFVRSLIASIENITNQPDVIMKDWSLVGVPQPVTIETIEEIGAYFSPMWHQIIWYPNFDQMPALLFLGRRRQ